MNKKVLNHFKKNDPLLYSFAIKVGNDLKPFLTQKANPKNYFSSLCREIIGQQLSGKVAEVIFDRFSKLYPKGINPKVIINTTYEKLRKVGMSNAKAKYVKNLAEAVNDNSLQVDRLDSLSDEEVKKQLIKVKGIGPWTAEMFLMFTLARPDVFSHGDLGLRKGIKKIYGFKKDPSLKTVEKIIKKWSPYKTYASLILWESFDVK
ncbi:MAG: putative DNA-3-methyladenine glycosylase [Candidatus Roizmanbacteria bacterium GW2011_GWC2_37_13]|uniref:DNA-3-methyladenine glycosylase II n=1 Tax=Candidatus Roizmanbacteria bacterium GW2011_GWC2_37_13 TaxID=1618486 RepID=A0A0G0GGN9_9BACT|nr:MAG: putative DNA-3-methyladenine glycosylase [Candidatus Roizmanbacteria bacterium GW2011_GWC1_37_12]KKQ25225.1 MAG: putative DNA-3-methyladenine glycosylase [Candidatus Roizmanbacteria bacterium GW2011_GWC2_37_13]